jgi:hypothetical protein
MRGSGALVRTVNSCCLHFGRVHHPHQLLSDILIGSRKQDAAHCSHAVTHSLQSSTQLSYCLDGITFLLSCFVCFCISERRVRKISPLILRRGTASLWATTVDYEGPPPRRKRILQRAVFRGTVGSPLRVSRRDANQLCVHKIRTENSVSFTIGFNGFDRNHLIAEMAKSVQNSSDRAASHPAPCGEKEDKSGRGRQIARRKSENGDTTGQRVTQNQKSRRLHACPVGINEDLGRAT